MTTSIIVAKSENNVIGKTGEIPWHLPADLKHFAKTTKGHSVIMGRKTFDSIVQKIGKPLPERKNIIITRQKEYKAEGCTVVSSIEEALQEAGEGEVFVIGGAEIYELALPYTDKLYITTVHTNIDGDVLFPDHKKEEWELTFTEKHLTDEKNPYDYTFNEFKKIK